MLSPETVEACRRMTPSERLRLTLQMIDEATPYLLAGPPEVVRRRFERLRQEKDDRNGLMLTALARLRDKLGRL